MNGSQKAACLLSVAALVGAACTDTPIVPQPVTGGAAVTGGMVTPTGGMVTPTGGMVTPTGGMVTPTGGMITGDGGALPTGGTVVSAGTCVEQGKVEPVGTCAAKASGIFGMKTVLDVWWDPPKPDGVNPSTLVNPGRGKIEIYMLATLGGVCQNADGSGGGQTVIRSCGSRMPPFTSEATCGVMDITIPDSAWEAADFPTFEAAGTVTSFEPGAVLDIASTTALIGIDMTDQDATFPDAHTVADVTCAAGSGVLCYPDHDKDTALGLTADIRATGEEAPVGQFPHQCSLARDKPYFFRAAPGDGLPDMLGGAVTDPTRLISQVNIGLRLKIGGGGTINASCDGGSGPADAEALEVVVVDCVQQGGAPCSPEQATFIAENTPQYQILQDGQAPSYTATDSFWWPPFSFGDTGVSAGSFGSVVRLGDLGSAVDCQMARDVDYGI